MRDVIIVGGGPAGLSAALILGRCRRSVLIYDDGKPRNARSSGVHGFLGHDGIRPEALRELGRAELAPYDVEIRLSRVVQAARLDQGFETKDAEGRREQARKLLLATGVEDRLPDIPGVEQLYGRGIYPCAYCDGWELRGKALGAYSKSASCVEFALGLTTWSRNVCLFTDGGAPPSPEQAARLRRHGVVVQSKAVQCFEDYEQGLNVILEDGARVYRDAVFLNSGQRPHSPLAESLGCKVQDTGTVDTFAKQRTPVAGLYLAGDASHDVKFAIIAAAHGARAAHDINQALREEDTV
jgi:thioredoxin reductase